MPYGLLFFATENAEGERGPRSDTTNRVNISVERVFPPRTLWPRQPGIAAQLLSRSALLGIGDWHSWSCASTPKVQRGFGLFTVGGTAT